MGNQNRPKLGVIGVGGLGKSLIEGVVQSGLFAPEEVIIFDIVTQNLAEAKARWGVLTAKSAAEAGNAEAVVLAVKPKDLLPLVEDLAPHLSSGQCLISVAAGMRLAKIAPKLPSGVLLIRAMPNACAAVRLSMTALCAFPGAEAGLASAKTIFGAIGEVVILQEESLLDPVTALSGSGPAFLFVILEALADGGVKAGLPRDVARLMAAQVMKGAAQMALKSGRHTAELKDTVTSPAGTTIEGLSVLESRGVRGAFIAAVDAASRKARELGE